MLVIIVLLILFCGFYRWKHRKFFRAYNRIPLVTGSFLNIKTILKVLSGDLKSVYKLLVYETRSSVISPRRMHVGPYRFVIIDNPQQIQKVLISKSSINKMLFYKNWSLDSGEFY
jgi:hypothetical protein